MQIAICIITVTGCTQSKMKPIPYLNNGQKWDKSIMILGDWDDNPETPHTYLHWAPVNVGYDASGEVASRDDHRVGRLFQWGAGDEETNKLAKERYYNEPKPDFWYTQMENMEGFYTGELWNNAKGPCPKGWRLPNATEFKVLMAGKHGAYGWTTSGNYAGMDSYKGIELFGMNEDMTPGTGVFFPAAGNINGLGSASAFGEMGEYWTSGAERVANPHGFDEIGIASALIFNEESCYIKSVRHSFGHSVRCVHD